LRLFAVHRHGNKPSKRCRGSCHVLHFVVPTSPGLGGRRFPNLSFPARGLGFTLPFVLSLSTSSRADHHFSLPRVDFQEHEYSVIIRWFGLNPDGWFTAFSFRSHNTTLAHTAFMVFIRLSLILIYFSRPSAQTLVFQGNGLGRTLYFWAGLGNLNIPILPFISPRRTAFRGSYQ